MGTTESKQIDAELAFSARKPAYWHFLRRDPLAFLSLCWIVFLLLAALIGPAVLGDEAAKIDLRARNTPPDLFRAGWMSVLGTDSLGRSMLVRIIVATRNTTGIALSAAFSAMLLGGFIGICAGYIGRWPGKVIMQFSDVVQSFPSMLMAMIVLYILEPRVMNVVLVLAFTRLPIYIRIARAEVLELRERLFVDAARVMGSGNIQIILRHITPMVVPTLVNILTVDFALVMLSESGLSFLGIGIQPPDITWGLMIAEGREYLSIAWWQAFFPGMMIMLSTLSINILYRWASRVSDPLQRWRFELQR